MFRNILGLLMKNNQSLRVACLTLINALISTPDDLAMRIHIRTELMKNGLIDVTKVNLYYVIFLYKEGNLLGTRGRRRNGASNPIESFQ